MRRIRVIEMIDEASLGGGQMHVYLLAKYLDPATFDVLIACEPSGFLVDKTTELGFPNIPVQVSNRFDLSRLMQLRSTLRVYEADVLHTHGGTAGFWGRVASLIAGTPSIRVHTYHGLHYLNPHQKAPRRFQWTDRALVPLTHSTICVCQSDFERGIRAGVVDPSKSVVIHNGIEVDGFRKNESRDMIRRKMGASPDAFVFGNIGRLHIQKGHRFLLEAFRNVWRAFPSSRLWIVGDGELREDLVQLSIHLGLSDAVLFPGAQSDIAGLLSGMDAFVLSSLWEGQPISLIEAMAAGKPLVSTNVDGVAELVTHGVDGLLVPAANSNELSINMMKLLKDKELCGRLSRNTQLRIETSHRADTMALATGDLYKRLLHDSEQKRGRQK